MNYKLRSVSVPNDIVSEVEKLVTKRRKLQKQGREFSFNAATKEALIMWIDAEKQKTKRPRKPTAEAGA